VLRLAVHAHADRQLDPPFLGALEQRQQPMARRIGLLGLCLQLLSGKPSAVLARKGLEGYGLNLLFLKLVRVLRVAPDHHQPVLWMQFDFGRGQEYLGEVVLPLEPPLVTPLQLNLLIIPLRLNLSTHRHYITQ